MDIRSWMSHLFLYHFRPYSSMLYPPWGLKSIVKMGYNDRDHPKEGMQFAAQEEKTLSHIDPDGRRRLAPRPCLRLHRILAYDAFGGH